MTCLMNSSRHVWRASKDLCTFTSYTKTQQSAPLKNAGPKLWNLSCPAVSHICPNTYLWNYLFWSGVEKKEIICKRTHLEANKSAINLQFPRHKICSNCCLVLLIEFFVHVSVTWGEKGISNYIQYRTNEHFCTHINTS